MKAPIRRIWYTITTTIEMFETILLWLLAAALLYLVLTSFVLIRNRFEFIPLQEADNFENTGLLISVCIPARNEEKTISTLLQSLLEQDYENFDIHVLDDQSDDNTLLVLKSFQTLFPKKLHIHKGRKKPENWLGKPWACHQLGMAANGNYLLFLDADTELLPGALRKIQHSFIHYSLDMLTVWPRQVLGSFWEKTVIPLVYYALVTILPVIYVYRKPRWMPGFLYRTFSRMFAAANGQCIAFKREAYHQIGGHQLVKDRVVEDVELAKKAKKAGLILRMFHGVDTISCRMYRTHNEMFNGLRKNFLAGFQWSITLFTLAALLHFTVFVLPWPALLWALLAGSSEVFFFSAGCISITFMHRLILSYWFEWDPLYTFTHPLGVLWFQVLGVVKIFDHVSGRKTLWKGRNV